MGPKYLYAKLEDEELPKNLTLRRQSLRFSRTLVIIHLCLFAVYASIFLGCASIYRQRVSRYELISSPVRTAVSYRMAEYDSSAKDEFSGPPSLKLDAAWQKILLYNNAVVQEEDLKRVNRTSVLLRDRSGYLAGIDMFHELHCLNYIREVAHRDYYKIEDDLAARLEHADHCIDTLRQVIQCHGDISLVKLDRSPIDGNLVQRPKQVSTCRNWDPIMKWARLQAPSHDHGPILEHPTLGILESDAVNETQAVSR